MKNLLIIITLLFSSRLMAINSIYDSPELQKVIDSAMWNIEASGELRIVENSWIETSGVMSCENGVSSEEILDYFEWIFDASDEEWKVKAQAWSDLKLIVGNYNDYISCEATTYVQYYDITWTIFYRDGYKIAFEAASEN